MAQEIAECVEEFEQSLKLSATAVKSGKKKKKTLKKSRSHNSRGGNPNSDEQDLTVSRHSHHTSSSGAHHSFASGDLLMSGQHDLNQGEKRKKRKKNKKRELTQSGCEPLASAGPKRDGQVTSDDDLLDFRQDRKLAPSENDHLRLERNDDSFRSTDSSVFSSHPTSQTQTHSYKDGRSSLLDDAESFTGGMIEGVGDSWDGFPISSSSRGVDFPTKSVTGANQDNEHVPSFFSADSAMHVNEPGQSAKEASAWNLFSHQDESSHVAPTGLSLSRSLGGPKRSTKNVAKGSFQNSNTIIQQKAEEAAQSAKAPSSNYPRPKPQHQSVISDKETMFAQTQTDPKNVQNDMLVRYLREMGTSFRTSHEIATSFREHQIHANVATMPAPVPSTFSPVVISSTKPSTRSDLFLDECEGMGITNNGGRQPRRGHRTMARLSQEARLWQRSTEPGAVPMEGRAFGAPVRPDLPARATEDDEALVVEAVEAMAVNDLEHGPMIYAESSPISWKDFLREKSIRRRIFIICFVVVIAVVVSVSLVVVQGPGVTSNDISGESTSTTDAPSSAPTFMAPDIVNYTAKLSGIDVVTTPGTPQHMAVGWLSTFDLVSRGFGDMFDQRYSLVTLFFALGGFDWIEQDSWLAPDMHECDWSGAIFCAVDGTGHRHLIGLDLTKNGLVGSLPDDFVLLPHLEFLRVSNNRIQGTLPSSLFNLPVLAVLNVHANELVGTLPENIGNVDDLVYLDVSNNRLTGVIPEGFNSLAFLRVADLNSNQFSGQLSGNLTKLKVLNHLDLSSNFITGSLPHYPVDDLPSFDSIDLGDNLITGTMPDWVVTLLTREELVANSNLLSGTFPGIESNPYVIALLADPEIMQSIRIKRVDLSDNKLSGTIPAWGGYLQTMEYMDFSKNKFHGRLPFGLSLGGGPMLSSLETLKLSNNFLTGTFPKELPQNINLIDVSGNLLAGTVPTEISNFTNLNFLLLENNEFLTLDLGSLLRHAVHLKTLSARNTSLTGRLSGADVQGLTEMEILDLAYNAITGTIPTEFGQLTSMKSLVLESNQLSGSIPSVLGSLSELRVLNLDNNRLSGSLPQTLGMLGRLEELTFAGNPQLSGSIPDDLCRLSTLNLTRATIGCELQCQCCVDLSNLCTT